MRHSLGAIVPWEHFCAHGARKQSGNIALVTVETESRPMANVYVSVISGSGAPLLVTLLHRLRVRRAHLGSLCRNSRLVMPRLVVPRCSWCRKTGEKTTLIRLWNKLLKVYIAGPRTQHCVFDAPSEPGYTLQAGSSQCWETVQPV